MTQISYMVGINDPRYFSKCFKQKMGMTPTEYRDKGMNKINSSKIHEFIKTDIFVVLYKADKQLIAK